MGAAAINAGVGGHWGCRRPPFRGDAMRPSLAGPEGLRGRVSYWSSVPESSEPLELSGLSDFSAVAGAAFLVARRFFTGRE